MDVVDKIRKVSTGSRAGHQDVPREAVVIEKVIVQEAVDSEK
jgi:peptidyl-prolyl cis-trans isomerase B (cyclophilin B)